MASTAVELAVVVVQRKAGVPVVIEAGQLEGAVVGMTTGTIHLALHVSELADMRIGVATHAIAADSSTQSTLDCTFRAAEHRTRTHQDCGRTRIVAADAGLLRVCTGQREAGPVLVIEIGGRNAEGSLVVTPRAAHPAFGLQVQPAAVEVTVMNIGVTACALLESGREAIRHQAKATLQFRSHQRTVVHPRRTRQMRAVTVAGEAVRLRVSAVQVEAGPLAMREIRIEQFRELRLAVTAAAGRAAIRGQAFASGKQPPIVDVGMTGSALA